MFKISHSVLTWLPRILSFAFMGFLMLFSFDVFAPDVSVGQALLGFLMHNIPVIVLAVIVALAWRREWVGAVIFAAAGFLYAALLISDKGLRDYTPSWIAIISVPALAVGVAYWIAWRQRISK